MGNISNEKFLLQIVLLLIFYCSSTRACHGQLLASGITAEDRREILHEHNKLRQLVATGRYPGQPGAENMREIVWDDELALRAQQWADNCEFRHDPHRTINRFTMGQNLAIIWSTAPLAADDGDFPSRIQSWFNEVQKYSFGDAWSPKTGHYSQLVWGETSLVGCGYSEYKDSHKYNKLWVCNYGPGGNVVGYNPYEVGKPNCGTYGMRPSPHYQGLCAAPTSPAVGLNTNTIETYEYTQTQNFNNKPTNFYYHTTTKYPQQATTSKSSPSSSLPQQATILSKHQYQSHYQQQLTSLRLPATISTTTSKATNNGGYSFGTKANGGSTAYTSEASQYKYKNKLETYKPSAAEFQQAVRKHTILRTSNNQYEEQQPQGQAENLGEDERKQQQQLYQQDSDVEIFDINETEQPQTTTTKPAKRGWSLLTWRG